MTTTSGDITRREFLERASGTAAASLLATAHPSSQERQQQAEFDFVVVGGGSSGCVVAARLSERPDVRVLLIEAGVPPEDDRVRMPGKWVSLLGSQFDWNYATTPQAALGGRTIAFPRGKALGGSSAINAMVYMRGHRLDYDHWNYAGNEGWSYGDVLPWFIKSERNDRGPSEFHGADGPFVVSDTRDPHAAHEAFLAAARRLGFDADPQWDFNGARQENAAGYYQKNILNGRRVTVAHAFITPALTRTNLAVVTDARALRVMFEGQRAVAVQYVRDGTMTEARASRAVVLSAGVIDTPKLLMLSGVGPADELRRHGIAVVADVPGVGGDLQDHLKVSVAWKVSQPIPPSTVSAGLFVRSAPGLERASPDLQVYLGRGLDQPSPALVLTIALERPHSRGTVRLRSSEPASAPVIDPRYLTAESDVRALVRGVRVLRDIGGQADFDRIRGAESDPGSSERSDAQLAQFVRRAADTIFHPACTCRMGQDRYAVVDAELRVRGVDGLRIADASVMPSMVNGNTNAACVMIGERAAALLAGVRS